MWRNYLTVGIRAFAKSRTYSIINVGGLAIGMAACLLILIFVRYESSYDSWIPGAENTYQFQTWLPKPSEGGGEPAFLQMTSYVTAERLKKDFPQVERTVYAESFAATVVKNGYVASSPDYLLVNDDFLKVVNLPLVRGSLNALSSNDTVVLTQTEAFKQFGTEDVVGRTLTQIQRGEKRDYRITGVLKDLPPNSHLKIAAIERRDFISLNANSPDSLTCWSCQNGFVYAKLRAGTDPQTIEAGLPAWEKRNIPDENGGSIATNPGDSADWHLVNVQDIHLGVGQIGGMTPGNDKKSIATFAIIAALILGMAMVNFINLATARASQRAREVALRKVLGANRRQLVTQFLSESVLMATAGMLIALTLLELSIKPLAALLDADLRLTYLGSNGILVSAVALTLLVGLAGGLYPAFFLSRFQPAYVLKANRSAAETSGSGRLRTILVIAQFAISIGLIVCTAVVYAQSVYARSVDPGYARDHILQLENLDRTQLAGKGQIFVDALKRVDGVDAVGLTEIGVSTSNTMTPGTIVPGNPKQISIGYYYVDRGYFDAMGLKQLVGRWFDEREADDSYTPRPSDPTIERAIAARGINIVLNERAVKTLGFASPQTALGKVVRSGVFSGDVGPVPMTVIGVVKDSRFRSIREPIEPLMFAESHSDESWMIIRFHGDPAAVRARVEAKWKQLTQDVPFEAHFSDDIIRDLYQAEDARAKTFAGFALLAVVIACLGLFGLAAFTAERRTKEIGIRKVLGARTRDIVQLLVWQFSRPVVIANFLAWPVAWWLMRDWLNTFDDRIALGPKPFLLAGFIAVGIAVVTVIWHAIKVARSNPIHALRYE